MVAVLPLRLLFDGNAPMADASRRLSRTGVQAAVNLAQTG